MEGGKCEGQRTEGGQTPLLPDPIFHSYTAFSPLRFPRTLALWGETSPARLPGLLLTPLPQWPAFLGGNLCFFICENDGPFLLSSLGL